MRLDSTNPRVWVPVATLLTTMALGCDGAGNETIDRASEFARKAAGDAGVVADGESTLDGSIVIADGPSTSLDGGTVTVTDDPADAAVQLSDDQIYGILVAYNNAELSAIKAGEGKLQDPTTVIFARAVTRSANTAKSRHTLLARAEGLTPTESEQSTQREQVARDIDTMLESEDAGDSLDLRYAFGEAMTNQLLIDTIDETLLPQADSERLKSELRTTRETAQQRVTEGGDIVRALTPSVVAEDPAADVTDDNTVTTDAGVSEP